MPEIREVRANANVTVHRTHDSGPHPTALCGEYIQHLASEARRWRGSERRVITECAECFEDVLDPSRDIEPGDLVTLRNNTHGSLPSNPRDWHEGKVYVYVGPTPHFANRSIILVEDGWLIRENEDRMPVTAAEAGLDTARLEAWSCQSNLLQHAPPGTDADEVLLPRIRRARNRLIALRPDVPSSGHGFRLCEMNDASGHPNTPHTHTNGEHPLWGDPETQDSGHRLRHDDGSYVLFVKGTHAHFATTESETQPVPPEQPAHPYPVGSSVFPLTNEHLRVLGTGSVVTVVSRNRGIEHGNRIQFGCKEFSHESLRAANATVKYQPNGITCEADVTIDRAQDYLTMAGQQISLGELRDYAQSVVVKEIVERPAENAFVMEQGFYGCTEHGGEVIFVGNGHPRGREAVAPVVGKLYPAEAGSNRLTGTVGQAAGLRQVSFADCTPVMGATTASTMHVTRQRAWALVPATEAQVARMRARGPATRFPVAVTTAETVLPCNMDGVPSVVPAMADASPF